MRIIDFLIHYTQAEELCVICDPWRIATVWIDHEDLFIRYLSSELRNKIVVKDEWKTLETKSADGTRLEVPAHYIYI